MQGDTPLVGQVVGNYEILRELGRGGMGVVYKAHETSLNRMVALKVLPAYLATDQAFLNRFVREARSAASLIHPNVVTIHAVGEDRGTHFIAMEYVKGQTLSQLIRQSGTIHPERALQIILDAADALAVAHKRGIVHRDIKPANIMIDEAGRVKVMDFGLARAVTSESNLTADGAMIGTPMYMSPEQCEGKKADQRSDIYALGVVLYEMLTGRTPYDATTPLAIMRQIVDRPFPDVHKISPVVSEEVNRILHRMVSKDIADRYQSIEDVRRDIRDVLSKSGAVGAIYNEKTVAVDQAATAVQKQTEKTVSQLETVLSPLPQTPPPSQPTPVGHPSGGNHSSALVGVAAAAVTGVIMLAGFLFLQGSDSGPQGGDGPAPAAVVAPGGAPQPAGDPGTSNRAVEAPSEEDVETANNEAIVLARRMEETEREETARLAAEAEAQRRADEQAALLAAAEEASRLAAAEEAAAALAELEQRKREAEEALAQLEAERAAREALEREAAALRQAEEEARRKAAELEQQRQEAEAAKLAAAQETAEQKAAREAAARKAAEEEAARKAAREAAARKAAEEEAARKAAEEEAARLAAIEAATPKYPDISGQWQASGTVPDAENRGGSLSPSATVVIDGTNARIVIDGKELTGQYVNGRLTGKYETTISAIGRSGKGRTQVSQVWEITLQAQSANRMDGSFSVTHSGFQASEAAKNGTRTQSVTLTR